VLYIYIYISIKCGGRERARMFLIMSVFSSLLQQ
jgi:hypothetical protein